MFENTEYFSLLRNFKIIAVAKTKTHNYWRTGAAGIFFSLLKKSDQMKLLYIPLLACLFLCSCHHNDDDYAEQTNLKIKVLKERGDSIEKANVERGERK